MIRQAHTYLVSAMSGATLIAIAIVAFVLLVSAQVFRDWPIAALGDNEPSISDSRATSSPQPAPTTSAAKAAAVAPQSTGSRPDNGGGNGKQNQSSGGESTSTGGPTATTSPVESGNTGSGNQGSNDAPSSAPAQSPSSSSSNQGSSSGGGKSESGSTAATTPTGKVTETVNETVDKVDETVTGGALEKTGVTEVTEGVANGVVGPESPVGKVVDETVKAVGGLLGGKP
ncbi:MAG TPA: hypothetical protein VMS11_11620 [Solirubrobacterales bacterium]|nr:hypothetical protein [Solirubrobacterales bacterium]